MNQIVFSVDMCCRKVVDNIIILLLFKFVRHKSDRLEAMLFTNSVTKSVKILGDYKSYVVLLLSFSKSLGSLFNF
jgi:hypothetical protein